MGAKFKIATNILGDRRVGLIVENPGFDSDATIQEAIDLGYVVGKKEIITRTADDYINCFIFIFFKMSRMESHGPSPTHRLPNKEVNVLNS